MSEKLVIYHNNCYDGVTAAWVCYKALDPAFDGMESDVRYLPMNYSDPPPDVEGKQVYIVDFSFKRDIMKQIILQSKSTIVLDHHKTAEAELSGILEELQQIGQRQADDKIIFDMNRSGAGLAWDFFFPNTSRPILVDYVEDRDLWKFKLPNSHEINAWIQSFDIDLNTWIAQVGPRSNDPSVLHEGKSLLRLQSKYVKTIAYNARLRTLPGGKYTAPYVQTSILMSEVCHQMLEDWKDYPFVYYSFVRKDGKTQYGMRSREHFDCSVIAKEFGGGGHKQAAGFELDE